VVKFPRIMTLGHIFSIVQCNNNEDDYAADNNNNNNNNNNKTKT